MSFMTETTHYHKKLIKSLTDNGVSHEVAWKCLGAICEDVQTIHIQAYQRGYNNGYKEAEARRASVNVNVNERVSEPVPQPSPEGE